MPIFWQAQPTPLSCGQACAAMLTGLPVERVCMDLGSATATDTRVLSLLLQGYGWASPRRLRRVPGGSAWADVAICKLAFRRRTGGLHRDWHWVLWADDQFWDPDPDVDPGGHPYPPSYGEITSYLPVRYALAERRAA